MFSRPAKKARQETTDGDNNNKEADGNDDENVEEIIDDGDVEEIIDGNEEAEENTDTAEDAAARRRLQKKAFGYNELKDKEAFEPREAYGICSSYPAGCFVTGSNGLSLNGLILAYENGKPRKRCTNANTVAVCCTRRFAVQNQKKHLVCANTATMEKTNQTNITSK